MLWQRRAGHLRNAASAEMLTICDDGTCLGRDLELHTNNIHEPNIQQHEQCTHAARVLTWSGPCTDGSDPRSRSIHTSSAANFSTAVKGASSGTLNLHMTCKGQGLMVEFQACTVSVIRNLEIRQEKGASTYTLNGSFGSDVSVTLKVTFDLSIAAHLQSKMLCRSCSATQWGSHAISLRFMQVSNIGITCWYQKKGLHVVVQHWQGRLCCHKHSSTALRVALLCNRISVSSPYSKAMACGLCAQRRDWDEPQLPIHWNLDMTSSSQTIHCLQKGPFTGLEADLNALDLSVIYFSPSVGPFKAKVRP